MIAAVGDSGCPADRDTGHEPVGKLRDSEATVGKRARSILTKLDLPPDEETHRHVLAVLAYLRGQNQNTP